jgi:Domain of unknown function (DUF397)
VSAVDLSRVAWRKSSRSTDQGNCVEVGVWRKSRRSTDQGACVEVATASVGSAVASRITKTATLYLIRDSKDAGGPRLAFTAAEWEAFTREVKNGRFDLI